MGKIADALGKYAQERKANLLPELTQADLDVLFAHDRKSGHLLNYDIESDPMGNRSLEVLRYRETIQRLLDNKLIYPGGKLTRKGVERCDLQQQHMPAEAAPVTTDGQTVEKPADGSRTADTRARAEEGARTTPQPSKLELQQIAQPGWREAQPPQEILIKEIVPPKSPPAPEFPLKPPQEVLDKPETETPAANVNPSVRSPVIEMTPVKQPVKKEPLTVSGEDKALTRKDLHIAGVPESEVRKTGKSADITKRTVKIPSPKFDDKKIDENLISMRDPQSHVAEQIKILRTNLLFPVSGLAPQSILVTGALPGDGKSFLSANLAVSIAMNINKHVMLIDCDLRKPDIHRIFGYGEVPGLSEYLLGNNDLESYFLKTNVEKLTLLPGGSVPPNPSELMSTERMTELLEEVKLRYHDRLIVIDSPPPAIAAETAFLARYVDGIILVVKQGKTPREEVEDVMSTVGSEKILGCVVNQLDVQISRYYGRKKYSKNRKRYYK